MEKVGLGGLDLVETELSSELCRWGQGLVVTLPLVRSLGICESWLEIQNTSAQAQEGAGWGREGCQELGSWHSSVVVTPPASWASGSMPLPNPKDC